MSDPIEDLVEEIARACPDADAAAIEQAAGRVRDKWKGASGVYIPARPASERARTRQQVAELVANGVKRRTAYRKVTGR